LSTVLVKLVVTQLFKKSVANSDRRLITMFSRKQQWFISRARWIHFTPCYVMDSIFVLTLSFHQCL